MKRGSLILFGVIGLVLYIIFFGKKTIEVVMDRMNGDRWNKLLPDMQEKTTALLEKAQESGLDVMFFEGWRSPLAEQADIDKGTSHLKDPYNSHHVWGAAVDIVFRNSLGAPTWPDASDPRWSQLEKIGLSVGLVHPITWDKPHFELPGFSIISVRNNYGSNYDLYLADNGVELA